VRPGIVLKKTGVPQERSRFISLQGNTGMNRGKQNLAEETLADWDPLGSLEKDWGPTGKV
jgi:hypothetical protein